MGSKRTKKSKQELEQFPERNIIKKAKEKEDDLPLEINNSDIENMNNVIVPAVVPKAPKRKKKSEGGEVAPKRLKKANGDPAKPRPRKRKPKTSVLTTENGGLLQPPIMNGEINLQNNKIADKGKELPFTWPAEDVRLLIDRIETNIPEKDILAYRSRVEKINWDNVAFKTYNGEDCKQTWILVQKRIRRFRLLGEILNDARAWMSAPKSVTKAPKAKRHPDMPRRPLSSYLLFYLKKKSEIVSENPGLEGSDLTKLIGQTYKNLPPEARQEYEKLAAANREEYSQKLKIFFANHPELEPPPKTNHRIVKVKDKVVKPEEKLPKVEKPPPIENNNKTPPTAPKPRKPKVDRKSPGRTKAPRSPKVRVKLPLKNQTPFAFYFASELKNKDPAMERQVFRDKCKVLYREMPDKMKMHWITLAEQDIIRYEDELKAFKLQHPEIKVTSAAIKQVLTKKEKIAKERAAGKPSKPPNSAYALYSRFMLQSAETKSITPKERMNYIANKWKNCPEEEQNIYKEQVVQLMDQYRQEWQAYLDTLPEDERKKLINLEKKKKRKSSGRPGRARSRPSQTRQRPARPKQSRPNRRPPRRPSKPAAPKLKFTEPEQPPISACKYFSTVYKGEGDAVQAWKTLSPEEKRKFEEELVKKKQAYIVEFEKFLKSLSKEELEAFSKSRQQQVKSDEESSDCSSDSEGEEEEEEGEDGQNNESDSG